MTDTANKIAEAWKLIEKGKGEVSKGAIASQTPWLIKAILDAIPADEEPQLVIEHQKLVAAYRENEDKNHQAQVAHDTFKRIFHGVNSYGTTVNEIPEGTVIFERPDEDRLVILDGTIWYQNFRLNRIKSMAVDSRPAKHIKLAENLKKVGISL